MGIETMEQVQREDRAWLLARLHHSAHGNWLAPDECATCLLDASEHLRLTPMARARIGAVDAAALGVRAKALGVTVGAVYSTRHQWWRVSARNGTKRVSLRAGGPLAAVIAGVLDDYEALA